MNKGKARHSSFLRMVALFGFIFPLLLSACGEATSTPATSTTAAASTSTTTAAGAGTTAAAGTGATTAAAGATANNPPPAGTLSVSVWGGPPDVESVKAATAAYTKLYPQVKFDIRQSDCGPDYSICKTLIAGGSMTDLVIPGIWNYNRMVLDGAIQEVQSFVDRDKLNLGDFNPTIIGALKSQKDTKLYGLPMGYNVQSLYFNKDMFDKAGLAYPPADGNYTWQDLRAWAKKLTLDESGNSAESPNFNPNKIKQWGFYTGAANTSPGGPGYEPLLNAFGGSVMTLPDHQKCNLENPDTIRGWQFIQDMLWKDHSTVTPDANQEQAGFLRWVGGSVAMQQGSHEQVGLVNTQNPTLKFDMAPLPKEKAGNATSTQLHIWAMFSGTKNKELAWNAIKWLATDGNVGAYGTQMGLVPAYKDLALGDAFLKAPKEPAHLKEAQLDPTKWALSGFPSPYNQNTDAIGGQDGFGPALQDIVTNKKSAADAVKGVCAKVDAIMAANK